MAASRYKQLVDVFAAGIRAGRLRPGDRLPTHRELAKKHGLALVTASRVYAELEAMGLVIGETGRGTFVRDPTTPPHASADLRQPGQGAVDLNFNNPVVPGQGALLREALRQRANAGDLDSALYYRPNAGQPHERQIVARYLQTRGLTVDAEQVAIVDGTQHGLSVILMALMQPGEVVAVEALSYPGFKVLADLLHIEPVAIPIGPDGPDWDALDKLCRARRVRAVYTMPTLHNPLGIVTGSASRQRLARLAKAHDLLVIEDAAYGYLAPDAPPPVATLIPERTVYVSSLSKNVATGLRFGFVAGCTAFIGQIERAIRATTIHTPGVITGLACMWIEDGTVARLEQEKRQDAAARQRIVDETLSGLTMVRHPSSYFVWLPLGEDSRADRVATTLAERGIAVSTAEPFATTTHVPQALRLALGSVDLATLRQALHTVREVVELDGL